MRSKVERYSCQLKLPDFGSEGQRKLEHAKVLICGAGGLGCPAAQYLVAAGVGTVTMADYDTVSASNLHRQILFTDKDVGQPKASVAANRLKRQNSDVTVIGLPTRITHDNVIDMIAPYDIVVDCTDNFRTRYLLNDACVLTGKPLVHGAAYQYEGHVAVWNVPLADGKKSSNYRDVFPSADAGTVPDCNTGGVLPTLTGIVGCMQAGEVIKYLTGLSGLLSNRLFILDAQTMQSRIVALPPSTQAIINRLQQPLCDEAPAISVEDLRRGMAKRKYQLVDVRTTEEHEVFNIGGKNIPLSEILADNATFSMGKPIVFYCRSGIRSARAALHVLNVQPDVSVLSLTGGVEAWQESIA